MDEVGDEVGTGPRGTAWGSSCGDAASRQSHESITQGSLVASVVSLVETHYAEGNGLSRFVDLGAATVATPGVCGSGELSGAASEHSRQNRRRKSATDSKIGSSFVPDWDSRKAVGCANLSLNRDVLSRLFHIM